MNPAQLLAHFDRISDAPDAIPHLRHFILELAVRGKLVEQPPAREVVHNDYINNPTSEEFPANWRVLNFGKFCDIQGGNQPPKNQFIDEPRPGYIRLFQIRDLGENPVPTYIPEGTTNRFCRAGEILIGRYGASVGKIFWAQDGAYNVALAKFIYPQNAYVPQFAFLILKSAFFQTKLTGATRSAQAGFNKGDLADIAFPLPPLAEQQRIVAKVDELMALCDRLEVAQAERENRRDRLVASSLNRLNNGADPDAFRNHARFYFNHIPRLTTRTEHIQQLRQTILNLAVRGKLVPQDPNDGQDYPELTVNEPQDAFELPPGWRWVAVKDLLQEKMANGISIKGQDEPPGIRALKLNSIKTDGIDTSIYRYLPLAEERAIPLKLRVGDFLLARGNGSPDLVARGALVKTAPRELTIFPDTMIRVRLKQSLSCEWFSQIWNSMFVRLQIRSFAKTAVGLWKVSQEQIGSVILALPPLPEQHRMVAKVDELMALCDRLEAQLTTTHSDSRRLLEAVLHEALTA